MAVSATTVIGDELGSDLKNPIARRQHCAECRHGRNAHKLAPRLALRFVGCDATCLGAMLNGRHPSLSADVPRDVGIWCSIDFTVVAVSSCRTC